MWVQGSYPCKRLVGHSGLDARLCQTFIFNAASEIEDVTEYREPTIPFDMKLYMFELLTLLTTMLVDSEPYPPQICL